MHNLYLRAAIVLLGSILGTAIARPDNGPVALLHSIFDPSTNAQTGASQGYSVVADGNIAVIGAPYDDVGAIDSGMVKIYHATTGTLLHSLTNPTPASSDWYGYSVAISGSLVLVGAPHDSSSTNGAGCVYVYNLLDPRPGIPMITISNPAPRFGDDFGNAVAISSTRVVVGARYDDSGANDAGSAYIFDLANASPSIPVTTIASPSPIANQGFGRSVAISGTRVVIGANHNNNGPTGAGIAYLYDLTNAQVAVPAGILTNPTPAQAEYFGSSVTITGTRVAIGAYGAKTVYVYDLTNSTPWQPVITLSDPRPSFNNTFGYSVAIADSRVLIGDPNYSGQAAESGSAYLYDLAGLSPTLPIRTISNPGPAAQDRFGNAVAITGERFLVGAPQDDANASNAGSVYLYDLSASVPTAPMAVLNVPSPMFGHSFGDIVSISGSHVVVGAQEDDQGKPNAGSVYVYDLSSLAPTIPKLTLTNPAPWFEENFGSAVAIDGTRIVVGAYKDDTGAVDAGIAYVYDLSNANTGPFLTLTNPNPKSGDWFGERVAVSDTWVVVAARSDDSGATNAGTAYAYNLTNVENAVSPIILTNPHPTTLDSFGFSVDYFGISAAVSGTRVAIGAPQTKVGGFYPGSVYVFDLLGHPPQTPTATLTNPNPRSGNFGVTLAMSGSRLIIGASDGISYLYDFDNGSPIVPVETFYRTNFRGQSIAISGTKIVIGGIQTALPEPTFRVAYLYDLASPTPTVPIDVLSNPHPIPDDLYGNAVGVDGDTFVVGAAKAMTTFIDHGAAYIFGLRPKLKIVSKAGFGTLSWTPTTSSGFALQHAEALAPTNWFNAPSGETNPVTLPLTNGARFYRLRGP